MSSTKPTTFGNGRPAAQRTPRKSLKDRLAEGPGAGERDARAAAQGIPAPRQTAQPRRLAPATGQGVRRS